MNYQASVGRVFEQFARIGKAISAPKRIELLDLLNQGPRNVETLAAQAGISVANASQHLQKLRAARLVDLERKGHFMEYRLADDEVRRFLLALRRLAEARLAEVEQVARVFLEQPESMEAVESDDLLRRVRSGAVTVLDVRPAEEYRAGHIPGALSVPLDELKRCLKGLPKDREIVAYCRGPYCVMAIEAVKTLRRRGYQAQRLELGVPDWRERGWRVTEGAEP